MGEATGEPRVASRSWSCSLSNAPGLADQLAASRKEFAQVPLIIERHQKINTSLRICFFLWQCYHNSIPVRGTLASCGLNISPSCPPCLGPNETLSHVLRDCPDSISFWNSFKIHNSYGQSFTLPVFEWVQVNCTSSCSYDNHLPWQSEFSFGVWNMWLRRNQIIFNFGLTLPNPTSNTLSFSTCFFFFSWGGGELPKAMQSNLYSYKMEPPPLGCAKLNTDGSSLGNPRLVGGGGVICDSNGC